MRWFSNLKTAYKLALGFGLCLALTGWMGMTALHGIGVTTAELNTIGRHNVPALFNLAQTDAAARQFRLYQYRLAGSTDPVQNRQLQQHLDEQAQSVASNLHEYEQTITQPDDRENFQALKQAWTQYEAIHRR